MSYDAFISYSQSADNRLAPAVQAGLQRIATPWYRRRSLHVFRDETGLAVDSHMWGSITDALDSSRYLVLLASPEAASSPAVNREVTYWLSTRSVDDILLVVTGGELVWSDERGRFDADRTTALPQPLIDAYTTEPKHLDLRWAHDEEQLDPRHATFRVALATLAAAIHGVDPEDIESQDVRLHRRAVRLAVTAGIALLAVTIAALISTGLAASYAATARDNEQAALANAAEAKLQRGRALTNAARARRQRQAAETNAARAARNQVEAKRQESLARANATQAQQNANEAHKNANEAAANSTLAQQNAARAAVNAAEAQRNAAEAQSAAQQAEDNATRAGAEKDRADQNAQEALSNATIALSRQLAATSLNKLDTDYDLALLQAVAANTVLPTAEAQDSLLRAVTSHSEIRAQFRTTQGQPTAVWINPTGDTIAAARSTGGIDVWDVDTGRYRFGFYGDGGPTVAAAAYGPRDELTVWWTGPYGDYFETINTKLGTTRYVTWVPGGPEGALAVSPNGRMMARQAWGDVPGGGGEIPPVLQVWDIGDNPSIVEEVPLDSAPSAVAFSPDGRSLAWSQNIDGPFGLAGPPAVFVHNLDTDTTVGPAVVDQQFTVDGSANPFLLLFSPEGDTLVAVANGGATPVNYIDTATGTVTGSKSIDQGGPIAATSQLLAVSDDSGTVSFVDLASGAPVGRPVQHRPITYVPIGPSNALSSDGRRFVAVREDGTIRIFDVEPGPVRFGRTMRTTGFPGERSLVSPDGMRVVLDDGQIFDARTGAVITNVATRLDLTHAVFSPDGSFLADTTDSGALRVIDLRTGTTRQRPKARAQEQTVDFAFHPDGQRIAVLTQDYVVGYQLSYWNYRTGTRAAAEPPFRSDTLFPPSDFQFGRDGTLAVLVGQGFGTGDVPPAIEIHRPSRPTITIPGAWTNLMVSPDGRLLAAIGLPQILFDPSRGRIDLFRIEDGARIGATMTPRRDRTTLESWTFDRRSRRLAMGASDGSIQIWDVASTTPIGPALEGHSHEVQSLAFRDDGRLVSTTSEQPPNLDPGAGEIVVWPVDAPSLTESACARANRDLTQAEWSQYVGNLLPYRPICPHPEYRPPPVSLIPR